MLSVLDVDVGGGEVAIILRLLAGAAQALDLVEDALNDAFICCVGDDFRIFKFMPGN